MCILNVPKQLSIPDKNTFLLGHLGRWYSALLTWVSSPFGMLQVGKLLC